MSPSHIAPLPKSDQRLLRWVGFTVPAADREEWTRSWQAELWWSRHSVHTQTSGALLTDLSIGLCRDALWLRLASWDRVLRGTAVLCLFLLVAINCAAMLLALSLYGGWTSLDVRVGSQLARFLYAAPLVIFVNFATATRPLLDLNGPSGARHRLQRKAFFTAKMLLVLQLSYLVSLTLCAPVALTFPSASDYLQLLFFVILSLVGLRWAFRDQELRCKQCLRLLNEPMRVGRPSNNLLTWSGTELACRQGHGLLTIPELETSWNQASEWCTTLVQ